MKTVRTRLRKIWPLDMARHWRNREIERFYRRFGFIPIGETLEQDIFVCGFPKSGNTWVQNLLASLIFGLEPRYLTDQLVQAIVPDVHQAKFYKRFFEPCFFKTHHTIRQEYRRVVHLVRDPRDVAVSFYHFDKARGRNTDLDAKVELVIDGWRRHSQGYINNHTGAATMHVRYEDLLKQPESEVQRLTEFAGLERSQAIRSRTVEGNCFLAIKRRETKFGIANSKWPSEVAFFRQGKSGAFSDTLSKHNILRIEDQLGDLMRHFDYAPDRPDS